MWQNYRVEIEYITELLGTQPQGGAREFLEVREDEAIYEGEEVQSRPKTTFYTHDGFLCLMDYQVKGWLKDAFAELPWLLGISGRKSEWASSRVIKGRIDKWLFVSPRHISFGKAQPDGQLPRILTAVGPRGPRVTPVESDYVAAGTRAAFCVEVLKRCPITIDMLKTALKYGEKYGMLQWRNAGHGCFKVISLVEEKPN